MPNYTPFESETARPYLSVEGPMKYNETKFESQPALPEALLSEPFCLMDAGPGKTGIVYGVVIEQGLFDANPTVHVPAQFADATFGDVIDLNWEGDVWVKWYYDSDGVGNVEVVGPDEPTDLVPYSPDSDPPTDKVFGYYVRIGSVGSTGFDQAWTGHIVVPSYGAKTVSHSWKITPTVINPGDPVTVNVKGGSFSTQGAFGGATVTVPDTDNLAVSDNDYVYLEIIRDSGTRELDGTPTITTGPTVSDSTEYEQRIELGRVRVGGGKVTFIHQTKFEDIAIFEDLAVLNGSFQLVPLLMSGKNTYDLP